MTNLNDRDRASIERGLLSTVAFDRNTSLGILQIVRRNRWVVRHLLRHERRLTLIIRVWPVSVENFTQNRIQWFFFRSHTRVSRRILTLERADEPSQYSHHSLFRCRAFLHSHKCLWVLAPAVICQLPCSCSGRKDELSCTY